MTTLAEIRADATPDTFPTDLAFGAKDAVCFYAAGFLGRNDVVHLAGVPFAVLVDTDEAKLMEMHRVYPDRWAYHVGGAMDFARRLAAEGRTFDVVTVDPWSNDVGTALYELPLWLSVTRGALVIGTCRPWFESMHLASTLDDLNRWIARTHWNGASVPPASRLLWRSDYRGGAWWIVFEKPRIDADPWPERIEGLDRG